MDAADTPMQLRLGFNRPSVPAADVTLELVLSGLLILLDGEQRPDGPEWAALSSCGIATEPHDGGGLCFSVTGLAKLRDIPGHIRATADPLLSPLWELVAHPAIGAVPALLEFSAGALWLRWDSDSGRHDVEVPAGTVPALLAAELPFVAHPGAWAKLRELSSLPVMAGRARLNLDGYIEIQTPRPQLTEAAPLPGLFRLDDTHFGLALPYADAISAAPGFSWDGPAPVIEQPPLHLTDAIQLSAHARTDLATLTARLAATRAAAVVWDPGLGRRILTLAAIDTLDAWPALIVTAPAGVWAWQRHVELFGRNAQLTSSDTDARIVSYLDLAHGIAVGDPASIIFDDPAVQEGATPAARAACHRLDGVLDAYRIAVCGTWPTVPEEQIRVCSLLRPREFRDDVPLVWRYPLRPFERATEHAEAYVTRRSRNDPGTETISYPRSSVAVVELTRDQREAIERVLGDDSLTDAEAFNATTEIVSVGTASHTSPKLAAVVDLIHKAARHGRRVAVVTRHRRAANILLALARPARATVIDATSGQRGVDDTSGYDVCIIRLHTTLPSLRSFDDVIVLDYPFSSMVIDAAVGPPQGPGPGRVTIVHAQDSIDDRLAMFAASRRERGGWDDPGPPNEDEVVWLLTPRTPPLA